MNCMRPSIAYSSARMKYSRLFPIDDGGGDDPVLADVGRPLPLVQRVLPDEAAAAAHAHAVAGSTIPAPPS